MALANIRRRACARNPYPPDIPGFTLDRRRSADRSPRRVLALDARPPDLRPHATMPHL